MDNRLKKYVKANSTITDAVATSITLDKFQAEFVKRNNLNLSQMVRDYLTQLIIETEGNKNGPTSKKQNLATVYGRCRIAQNV